MKYFSLISIESSRFVAIGIKKKPFSQLLGAVFELVFDVKNNELELFQLNIKSLMESVVDMKIPLSVDIGYGKNWLEAH